MGGSFLKHFSVALPSLLAVGMLAPSTAAIAQQRTTALPPPPQAGGSLPVLPPIMTLRDREDALIGVAERFRPEFQPSGTRLGSFLVFPSVRTGIGYDSNIFAQEDEGVDDLLYAVEPVVTARSTWSTNELRLQARGGYLDYADTDNASETTYQLSADGRFLLSSPAWLDVGANFAQRVERRDSSSFPDGTVAPVRYRVANGYASGTYDLGSVSLVGTGDFTRFDFSDTDALDDDQQVVDSIYQGFRDHQVARVAGRVVAQLAPRIAVFGQGVYADFNYDDTVVPGGLPNRDGDEFQATAGLTFEAALLQGEVGVGYLRHRYDATTYDSIEGLAFDARLRYFLTPLVTLTAEGSRTVEETAIIGSSGFLSTRARFAADYELLRNLILNADVTYRSNDFRGIDRQDRILRFGGGGRYLITRRVHWDVNGFVLDRSSEDAALVPNFTELRVTTGVTFRL